MSAGVLLLSNQNGFEECVQWLSDLLMDLTLKMKEFCQIKSVSLAHVFLAASHVYPMFSLVLAICNSLS